VISEYPLFLLSYTRNCARGFKSRDYLRRREGWIRSGWDTHVPARGRIYVPSRRHWQRPAPARVGLIFYHTRNNGLIWQSGAWAGCH